MNRLPQAFISRREVIALLAAGITLPALAQSGSGWAAIEAKAKGQTVYFNAWAGSERINAYLQWVGTEVLNRYGVTLEHVKITDAAEVVKRVRNEKAAGKLTGGTVDMVWINGENFLNMKKENLLFGPFAENLPNFSLVDVEGKPTTKIDFSEPVEGMEAPWGMAQLTFFADRKRVPAAPKSMPELLAFAKVNPGRVTYPRLPDFHGTTFVKQALLEANIQRKAIYQPVTSAAFATATKPLWAYLDALHPHLWRAGKQFPQTVGAVRQMMADGELLLAFTFNPNEAANEIAARRLPESVYSYQFSGGTVGNTHFIAIPFNSGATDGAQVVINFLLSAQAQARKANITHWGDPTVLAMDKLAAPARTQFSAAPIAGLVEKSMPTLAEPHGSWVEPLEREWLKRYGQ